MAFIDTRRDLVVKKSNLTKQLKILSAKALLARSDDEKKKIEDQRSEIQTALNAINKLLKA